MAYHISTSSLLPQYHTTSDPVTILVLPLTQILLKHCFHWQEKNLHGYSSYFICLQNHSISINTPLNASVPLSVTPSVTVQLLPLCRPPSRIFFHNFISLDPITSQCFQLSVLNTKTVYASVSYKLPTQTHSVHMRPCTHFQCRRKSIKANDWRRVDLVHSNAPW